MPSSTWIDRSGTITVGGAAQTISAGTTARHGFTIQNVDAAEVLWFNVGVAAVQAQPSVKLAAGALYETPPGASPQGLISVIATTTSHQFTAKEW